MGVVTNLFGWPNTTLVNVFEEAENAEGNQLDVVEMELKNGRTFAIAVISGPHTVAVTQAMREAKGE